MDKKKFEIKFHFVNGNLRKDIFIEGELFDYSVDKKSLMYAESMGKEFYTSAQRDIEKHFLESLSEFLGRNVTKEDVMNAQKTGMI